MPCFEFAKRNGNVVAEFAPSLLAILGDNSLQVPNQPQSVWRLEIVKVDRHLRCWRA